MQSINSERSDPIDYHLAFLRLKDRQHLFEAFQVLIDSMDPLKWLPADFESLESGIPIRALSIFSFYYCFKGDLSQLDAQLYNSHIIYPTKRTT